MYQAKTFVVVYRPFPQSDVTATQDMTGANEAEVKAKFEKRYTGDIVSITEK